MAPDPATLAMLERVWNDYRTATSTRQRLISGLILFRKVKSHMEWLLKSAACHHRPTKGVDYAKLV